MGQVPKSDSRPDLDNAQAIDDFVRRFYERLLEDPEVAPLFLQVARVDLARHLPLIAAYWKKMLLGEPGYDRHTMRKHRELNDQQSLTPEHGRRWLACFEATLDAYYTGSGAERARRVARNVMNNLMRQLNGTPAGADSKRGQ